MRRKVWGASFWRAVRRLPSRQSRLGSALRVLMQSAVTPAVVVLVAYGLWIGSVLRSGHEVRDFIFIGRDFVTQSHSSGAIRLDPSYHYVPGGAGYDGQFSYFIALDPVHARYYLDSTARNAAGADYRYTRILYPMLARALALGRADAIPTALLAINWIALGLGTLAVAAWLRRKGLSPWIALVFGLYPGLFVALQRDLNEALAYALVAIAVYFYDLATPRFVGLSALSFALASLTRETTLVFPLVYVAVYWRPRRAVPQFQHQPETSLMNVRFIVISFAPFILYKLFLWHWLGTIGRTGGLYPQPVPLGGIFSHWAWNALVVEQIVAVVIPGLVCLGAALWAARRQAGSVALWLLVANALLFVVFLNSKSYAEYYASGRIAAGVVLAAIYCLPTISSGAWWRQWWFWLAAALWFSLLPALVPFPRRAVRPTDAIVDLALVVVLWILSRVTQRATGSRTHQPRIMPDRT